MRLLFTFTTIISLATTIANASAIDFPPCNADTVGTESWPFVTSIPVENPLSLPYQTPDPTAPTYSTCAKWKCVAKQIVINGGHGDTKRQTAPLVFTTYEWKLIPIDMSICTSFT